MVPLARSITKTLTSKKQKPDTRESIGLGNQSDSRLASRCESVRSGEFGFDITEATDDFENLAPCRKHATTLAFVIVHRLHELDLVARVIAFAGRRVDQTAAFNLGAARGRSTFFTDVLGLTLDDATIRLISPIASDSLVLNAPFDLFDPVCAVDHINHLLSHKSWGSDPSPGLGESFHVRKSIAATLLTERIVKITKQCSLKETLPMA